MARDPNNVNIWIDAHVYVSLAPERPALPVDADTVMAAEWAEVGILDGDDGFTNERNWDSSDVMGWGVGKVATIYSKYAETRAFTVIEDNDVVRSVLFAGSTDSSIVVPRPAAAWVCFETNGEAGVNERYFTTVKARLWAPNADRKESDVTKYNFTANIYANGASELYDRQASVPA